MIRIVNKYSLLIACLLVSVVVRADTPVIPLPGLPACPACPPPAPDMSIDDDLLVFLVFGFLFGFYKIYVFTKKKKCSI